MWSGYRSYVKETVLRCGDVRHLCFVVYSFIVQLSLQYVTIIGIVQGIVEPASSWYFGVFTLSLYLKAAGSCRSIVLRLLAMRLYGSALNVGWKNRRPRTRRRPLRSASHA